VTEAAFEGDSQSPAQESAAGSKCIPLSVPRQERICSGTRRFAPVEVGIRGMTRDHLKMTAVRSDSRTVVLSSRLPWLIGGVSILLVSALLGTGLLSKYSVEVVLDDQELAELEAVTTGSTTDRSVTSAVDLRSTTLTTSRPMIWLTGSIEVEEETVTSHDAHEGEMASHADYLHQVAAK
jgi:hypothetical protein